MRWNCVDHPFRCAPTEGICAANKNDDGNGRHSMPLPED